MKNIVLVVETSIPPVSRANLRLYRLGLVLIKRGYKVWMISPSEVPYSKNRGEFAGLIIQQYRGFCKFLYSKGRTIVRIYHLIATMWCLILLNLRKRIDVIHAWNPPAGLASVIVGIVLKKPVYYDFTDFYSDIAVADYSILVNVLKWIEKLILKLAKKIIVVSNVMGDELLKIGVPIEKIYIVPDGTDGKMFNPTVDGEEIRKKWNLERCPTIIYHGDIKYNDGVDLLLVAFSLVLIEVPDAKLLILGGGGAYFEKLKILTREKRIDDSVIFAGWVPHQDVPKYIRAADIGAITVRPTLNHQCYLSFKLFEYWGCAKPVVVSRLKAISQIMKDGVQGIIIEPENIEETAQAFIGLLKNKEKAKKMGAEGRRLVEEIFDWNKIMEREADLYEEIP